MGWLGPTHVNMGWLGPTHVLFLFPPPSKFNSSPLKYMDGKGRSGDLAFGFGHFSGGEFFKISPGGNLQLSFSEGVCGDKTFRIRQQTFRIFLGGHERDCTQHNEHMSTSKNKTKSPQKSMFQCLSIF